MQLSMLRQSLLNGKGMSGCERQGLFLNFGFIHAFLTRLEGSKSQ